MESDLPYPMPRNYREAKANRETAMKLWVQQLDVAFPGKHRGDVRYTAEGRRETGTALRAAYNRLASAEREESAAMRAAEQGRAFQIQVMGDVPTVREIQAALTDMTWFDSRCDRDYGEIVRALIAAGF